MFQKRAILPLFVLFTLVFSGVACKSGGGSPDWSGAWVACKNFVKQSIKSPASAQFPEANAIISDYVTDLGGGKYRVDSYVDAQNGFGALIRADFSCIVEYKSSSSSADIYRLIDLDLRER